jgi:hypothetical protein
MFEYEPSLNKRCCESTSTNNEGAHGEDEFCRGILASRLTPSIMPGLPIPILALRSFGDASYREMLVSRDGPAGL